MSSETFPAAVTDPAVGGHSTPDGGQVTPRKSAFAAFLEPVAPVATTPENDTDSDTLGDGDDTGEQAAGGSSAEYKTDGNTDTGGDDNAIKNQKSIPRAFLLAMAQRWAKGGGTANKRLDVQKARAQARQIKTSKTVNGAGLSGLLGGGKSGGSSGSGRGADKGGAAKKFAGGGRQGSGNSGGRSNGPSGSGGRGPSGASKTTGGGRGNSGGKGNSGGGGRGGNSPKTGNNRSSSDKGLNKPRTKNDSGSGVNKTPKNVKTPGGPDGARPWHNNKTQGGGKNNSPKTGNGGGNTPNGPSNKNPKTLKKTPASPQGPSGSGSGTTQQPKTNTTKTPKPVTKTPKTPRPWHRTPVVPKQQKQPKNTQGPGQPNTPQKQPLSLTKTPKPNPTKNTPPTKPGPNGTTPPVNLTKNPKTPAPNSIKPKTPPTNKTPAPAPQQPTKKSRLTQKARETGYWHGTRIGEAAAQASAYRDGVKDGIQARAEHGDREKREMDAIHARRKKQHEEKTMTTAAPEAPLQIPATRVDNTIHLGPGADRPTMSGGEVRNMKDFQDKLGVKAYSLQWKAEDLKAKKAKIAELAKRAAELAENGKALALGGKSVSAATRASAAIGALDAVADELQVRLTRGIDETNAVKSNTETRYGQIYKAVVDSDEQAPAKDLSYYATQGA